MPGRAASVPPGYRMCGARHTRPGGERVACTRLEGHDGWHAGRATGVPVFTWPDVIDLTAVEQKEQQP